MTTTFHFEMNEPQYDYSSQGADVLLRCEGLVGVATGPAHAFEDNAPRTWYELTPVAGKRILAGVGRTLPSAAMASAYETREAIWANAMADLGPLELAESSSSAADCVYAVVDPSNGHVELGRAGRGASVLIFDGSETRLAQPASSDAGDRCSASFELSAGSTLLLLTHDPAEGKDFIPAIQRALAARSVLGGEVDRLLERCLELRSCPLSACESIVALHFERPDGSLVMRRPADPPPCAGEVVHEDAFVTDGKSEAGLHQSTHHAKRCRRRAVGTLAVSEFCDVDGLV